jgi:hypothetical protein
MPRIPDNEDSFDVPGSDFFGEPQIIEPTESLTASGAPLFSTTLRESDMEADD